MADKDKDLTNLFVRDLDDIPLPSRDKWRPAPRKESNLMKSSRYVLYAGAIAAVLVVALIASFQLRGSNPVAASPSPSASTSPAPTASASSTPAATPIGFVLPADCSYVSGPLPVLPAGATPNTYWEFTCAGAATPDLKAVERIAPAFTAQGWTPCPSNPGTGVWWKGAIQTMVGQGTRPGLSQFARQLQDCPGGSTAGPTLAPGTFENPALGYRIRPPDGYRRYATLIVPGPDGVGVDWFTARTDAEERDLCVRQKGSDLPPRETASDLQIRVVSNAGGVSALDYASAPNRRIPFTTIQPTTINGFEAAKVVHQPSGDTSSYVIRANGRIYEFSPVQDEQPSPLPKAWLDQIVATFSAITPDASPAAVDTRTRC